MQKQKRAPKAYRNLEFINSPDARTLRILAEFYEPRSRFKRYKINNSIVFFGSARSEDMQTTKLKLKESNKNKVQTLKLARYYEQAEEFAFRLTAWSKSKFKDKEGFHICSGGGPGMMEAANRGAQRAGGKSIGLNISLPMEQFPNAFIDDELNFEFHYFFMRKFWFVYLAKGVVIFPGGFGTMDELFEVLTLVQTKKIKKNLPIVMFGTEYWNTIINFDAMVNWGTIAEQDLELIKFCDDIDVAFDYLTARLNNHTNQ